MRMDPKLYVVDNLLVRKRGGGGDNHKLSLVVLVYVFVSWGDPVPRPWV